MFRKIACTFALLGLATGAAAQTPDAADVADPIYHVEIIIFAYNDANRGEEDFLHGIENPVFGPAPRLLELPRIDLETLFGFEFANTVPSFAPDSDSVDPAADAATEAQDDDPFSLQGNPNPGDVGTGDLLGDNAGPADSLELFPVGQAPAAASDLPNQFRILDGGELELTSAYDTLRRLRAYRVLGHVGWAQTGVDTDRAVAIDLDRLGITNPVGTITLYLRRFLHVAVDLEYIDGRGSFWTAPAGFGLAPLNYAQSYHLTIERNAIRSSELHYIDHPLFGILVRITPAPERESLPPGGDGGPAA